MITGPFQTLLVRLPDGTVRASDGLVFTEYARVTYGGVPELALTPDGCVRLYVCAAGIDADVSADEGVSCGARIICDPSMVAGTDVFVFKVQ